MNSTFNPDEGEALRRAFAQDPSRSTADPVDADALWEAVQGDAGPEAVAALADRMARDPALAEDWRLASAFAAEAEADVEDEDEPSPLPSEVVAAQPAANHGDYMRWGAVVAMVAAAVLLVMAWPRDGASPYEPSNGQMRGGGGAIQAVRGEGVMPRDEVVLEWSEVPGAVRYELHVSTADLEPRLEQLDLETTSMTVPAEVVRDLPVGTQLLWRVEAVRADQGHEISETFAFTLQ